VPPQAEEEPSAVTEMRAPATPPPPIPATAVEEGEAVTEATVTQAALEAPSEAASAEGMVMVLDEESVPPPPSESHDVVMALALELAQVPAMGALSLLWRCRCPLQQWKFKVLSRPRRWRSPLRPEFPSWSRR
jgi:hypothetical protein